MHSPSQYSRSLLVLILAYTASKLFEFLGTWYPSLSNQISPKAHSNSGTYKFSHANQLSSADCWFFPVACPRSSPTMSWIVFWISRALLRCVAAPRSISPPNSTCVYLNRGLCLQHHWQRCATQAPSMDRHPSNNNELTICSPTHNSSIQWRTGWSSYSRCMTGQERLDNEITASRAGIKGKFLKKRKTRPAFNVRLRLQNSWLRILICIYGCQRGKVNIIEEVDLKLKL